MEPIGVLAILGLTVTFGYGSYRICKKRFNRDPYFELHDLPISIK